MRAGMLFDQILVKLTPLISTSCMFQELTYAIVPVVNRQKSPTPSIVIGMETVVGLEQVPVPVVGVAVGRGVDVPVGVGVGVDDVGVGVTRGRAVAVGVTRARTRARAVGVGVVRTRARGVAVGVAVGVGVTVGRAVGLAVGRGVGVAVPPPGKTNDGWLSRNVRVAGPMSARLPLPSTPFEVHGITPCQPFW